MYTLFNRKLSVMQIFLTRYSYFFNEKNYTFVLACKNEKSFDARKNRVSNTVHLQHE